MAVQIPLRARIRKRLRITLDRVLSTVFTARHSDEPITINRLQSVLIVRSNHRIGNLLFQTPLLRALHELLPNCRITLVIGLPAAKSLLQPLPGVDKVYVLPKTSLAASLQWLQLLRNLHSTHYDLVIDPNGKSASGRLLLALSHSRWKLGFAIEDTWSPLTHRIALPRKILHEAQRPLLLLPSIQGGSNFTPGTTLELALSVEEKSRGARTLQSVLSIEAGQKNIWVLGLFRFARRDKRIPDDWWLAWIQAFRAIAPQVQILEILSPDAKKPLLDNVPSLQSQDLRLLAAILSQLDAFICADTGPMHLASAAGAPTIALFNATQPDLYGPVGARDLVLQQNQHSIPELAGAAYAHIAHLKSQDEDTGSALAHGVSS